MKRLRLCSRPALHSICSKRICCSSVRLEVVPMNLRIGRTRPADLSFNLSHNPDSYLAFNISGGRSPAGRAPLYAEKVFGIQRYRLAVPAAGTRRRSTDRSFPASKILRGSLRRHPVFKVQYYDAAARAANPADGLRRSGAASRFGDHEGVLSCGRKHERTDAGSSAAVLPTVRADKTDSPRTFSDKFVNE